MCDIPPELDSSLADLLLEHLSGGRIKEAKQVTTDNRFQACLKSNCSDTIAVLARFLTTPVFQQSLDVFETSEEILKIVTQVANPQEVLLEILVLLEDCSDDNHFRSVLKALQICLLRLPANKILSVDHAFEAILEFLNKLPYVQEENYTEKKQKLLENEGNITRFLTNYVTLTLFLPPLLEEFCKTPLSDAVIQENTRQGVLIKFLLNLLRGSFARLHLKVEEKPLNTYSRQCSGFFVESITKLLHGDPYCILESIEMRFRWPDRTKGKNRKIFQDDVKVSTESLLIFFYILHVGQQLPPGSPQIYSPIYIFEISLYLIASGLEIERQEVKMKSVELLGSLLESIDRGSLQSNHLDLQIHANLCLNLTKVMIYCNSEDIRKTSIDTFREYLFKFDDNGRFLIIEKLFEKYKVDVSNFRGFLTTTFKDFVAEILAKGENRFPVQESFHRIMIRHIIILKDREATDVIQEAEAIISALNTIRFLALRDHDNRTSFWNLVPILQRDYLTFIRKSVDLGRVHYEAEKMKIEKNEDEEHDDGFSLTVGHEEHPKLTRDQKLFVMNNSLMKLDVIESVLARVHECIVNIPNSGLLSRRFLAPTCIENNFIATHQSRNLLQPEIPSSIRYFSSQNPTPSDSINDFRAREEAREAQFEETHRAEESTQAETPQHGPDAEEEKVNRVREEILRAALEFAPSMGWSREAITKGAETAGYPGVVHGLFPDGGVELIQYFYSDCNARLVQWLETETKGVVDKVPNPSQFVTRAIETRLRMLQPFLSTWPQAIGILSLPQNAPKALANLLTLADDICFYSGDRAVNISWYTRRVGVAGIIKITELYMLQDKSVDHQATWKFLERRMEDAVLLHSFFVKSEEANNPMQKAITSAFETGKNILGLNFRR
ncbi:Ubiquinone biosynthesis protein COQ9, mitochondrial [Sergentomyia squamirostris]